MNECGKQRSSQVQAGLCPRCLLWLKLTPRPSRNTPGAALLFKSNRPGAFFMHWLALELVIELGRIDRIGAVAVHRDMDRLSRRDGSAGNAFGFRERIEALEPIRASLRPGPEMLAEIVDNAR